MDPKFVRLATLCAISGIAPSIVDRQPWERIAFQPEPNDDPSGGGKKPDPAPPPTPLTQADVDKIVEQRLAADRKARGAALDEATKKAAELEATLAKEREEWELKGKSEADKARIRAEQAAKKIETDKAEADKKAAAAEARALKAEQSLRQTHIDTQVSAGLLEAKALPAALKHAAAALLADLEIETDPETHKITSVRLLGVTQPSVAKAAEEWLKTNPHFAAAAPGGTGSRGQGGGIPAGTELHKLSPTELLALDAKTPRPASR